MANASVACLEGKLNVINVTAAAATTQGDLVIFGPWLGVALNTAAIGETLSLDIEEGKRINCSSAVDVAAAIGDAVYYNPTTGAFAASAVSGNYLAGYTTQIKDANNTFQIEKVRKAVSYADATITLSDISDLSSLTVTMSQVSDLGDLAIADLSDVTMDGTVTTGQVLKYDTDHWENGTDLTA